MAYTRRRCGQLRRRVFGAPAVYADRGSGRVSPEFVYDSDAGLRRVEYEVIQQMKSGCRLYTPKWTTGWGDQMTFVRLRWKRILYLLPPTCLRQHGCSGFRADESISALREGTVQYVATYAEAFGGGNAAGVRRSKLPGTERSTSGGSGDRIFFGIHDWHPESDVPVFAVGTGERGIRRPAFRWAPYAIRYKRIAGVYAVDLALVFLSGIEAKVVDAESRCSLVAHAVDAQHFAGRR